MLSMTGREKFKKAVERMRALGCETQEEIIAMMESENEELRKRIDQQTYATKKINDEVQKMRKDSIMIHEIKSLPEFFEEVRKGEKVFELRKNDRDYRVGDLLILKEWDGKRYTGRQNTRIVNYVFHGTGEYGLEKGYCILGIGYMDDVLHLIRIKKDLRIKDRKEE